MSPTAALAKIAELEAKLAQPCGSCHPCTQWANQTWINAKERLPHVYEWQELRAKVARVEELFAGGPDTPCRTAWRESPGLFGAAVRVECVEVPIDDLRAALDNPAGQAPTVTKESA